MVTNWDGPFVITQIISECTVVIRSEIGRLYKSNVSRLQPWRGREQPKEGVAPKVKELAIVKLPEPTRKVPKRGPGRPKGSARRGSRPRKSLR